MSDIPSDAECRLNASLMRHAGDVQAANWLDGAADRIESLTADLDRTRSLLKDCRAGFSLVQADLAAARSQTVKMHDALDQIGRYAEDSIGMQYGTLSAEFVANLVDAALAALPTKEDDRG